MMQDDFIELKIDYSLFPKTGNTLSIYLGENQRYTKNHPALRANFHKHSFYELHFVLEGEINYRFSNGECIKCSCGYWIIVLPQVSHAYEVKEDTLKSSYQFVLGTNEQFNNLLENLFEDKSYVSGPITDEIMEIIKRQGIFTGAQNLITTWIMKNNALNLILMTINQYVCNAHVLLPKVIFLNSEESIVFRTLKFIEDNADRHITSDEVIRHSGIYRKKFNQIFQRQFKKNISQCIAEYRIKYAITELEKNSEKSICEISEKLDFCNVYYFSRFFKRHTGLTPSQYRNRMKTFDE